MLKRSLKKSNWTKLTNKLKSMYKSPVKNRRNGLMKFGQST